MVFLTNPATGQEVSLAELLAYSPDTGGLLWKHRPREMFAKDRERARWNTRYAGKDALTLNNGHGYRSGRIFGSRYFAHRVVWALVYDEWPDEQIDHIDGNRTNNRIENLRAASSSENNRNSARRRDNTSGVTGVHWDKQCAKWSAQVMADGRRERLGIFTDFSEAVAARKAAEVRYGFHKNHGRSS